MEGWLTWRSRDAKFTPVRRWGVSGSIFMNVADAQYDSEAYFLDSANRGTQNV